MNKSTFTIITLLGSLLVAIAQPATGETSAYFAKAVLPLWDLTGMYDVSQGGSIAQNTLSHSPSGGLSMTGSQRYDDDAANSHASGTFSGSGRVSGTLAGGTKGFIRARGTISGVVNGSFLTENLTARSTYTVDPTGGQLIESSIVRECVSGRPCSTSMQGQGFALGRNGSWGITTILSAIDNRLSGSAVLVLTNGRGFHFTATGVWSPRSDLSTIKLVGSGESTGANLTIAIRGSDRAFVRVRGVVLGQRLQYSL